MEENPNLTAPPSDATNHGQILYALGLITGEMKGLKEEMQGLKDAKLAQNGKVDTLRNDVNALQRENSAIASRDKGMKTIWVALIATIAFFIGSVLIPLLAAYIQKQ